MAHEHPPGPPVLSISRVTATRHRLSDRHPGGRLSGRLRSCGRCRRGPTVTEREDPPEGTEPRAFAPAIVRAAALNGAHALHESTDDREHHVQTKQSKQSKQHPLHDDVLHLLDCNAKPLVPSSTARTDSAVAIRARPRTSGGQPGRGSLAVALARHQPVFGVPCRRSKPWTAAQMRTSSSSGRGPGPGEGRRARSPGHRRGRRQSGVPWTAAVSSTTASSSASNESHSRGITT